MKEDQANLFLRVMHNLPPSLLIHELRALKKCSRVELIKNPTIWSTALYWAATKEGKDFWFKAYAEDGKERKAARKKILRALLSASGAKPSEDYL